MRKRKRSSDQNNTPPPPDVMPYSSRMDSLSKGKSSHTVDNSTLKSLSSIMDAVDSSGKLPNTYHSQQNLSRALLLRHPRHFYGRQYYRRKSAKNGGASSSQDISTYDKLSFKFTNQCNSDSGRPTENKEKAFCGPERTRFSCPGVNAVSTAAKMVCGICAKLLKRKPYLLENTISSGELSVVAILVCGHVYHAECLEQRTGHEDRWDPPCPLCVSPLSQLDALTGQN